MSKKVTVLSLQRMFANPFYAIEIHPGLSQPHEPMVTKEMWVKANLNMIKGVKGEKGMGIEKWLNTLLEVLEGNYE